MFSQPTILVVAGPTAVGKTAIAIELAKHFDTSIISADSRQCFRELGIGVAKPSAEELAATRHYFIDSHSIHDHVDAAVYETYALEAASDISGERPLAVVAGGTGMYIKAFCEGLDKIPAVDPATRQSIRQAYQLNGIEWLQQIVAEEDPEYYATGEIYNPQRLLRALEVKRTSGRSIRSFQNQEPVTRPFHVIKIGLELPREELTSRINKRVEMMMEDGLLEEVRALRPCQQLNALQTVGYKEFFDHFNGLSSIEAAIELVKINTRQYAKRQVTWFKKDPAIHWFAPGELSKMLDFVKLEMNKLKLPS